MYLATIDAMNTNINVQLILVDSSLYENVNILYKRCCNNSELKPVFDLPFENKSYLIGLIEPMALRCHRIQSNWITDENGAKTYFFYCGLSFSFKAQRK